MNNVKGTRDFYPEDMNIQNQIFDIWKKIARSYNYKEMEGPILESEEIYKKSGDEIPEQTYQLEDKSKRRLVLRPELTPTIARMIQQRKDLPKPIKWFSIPRCFRYEAPQAGRSREFYQFNLDCLGSSSMAADAEVIATAVDIMRAFGLTEKDFYIRISNRKILQSFLLNLNISNVKGVFRLIDKKDKIGDDVFAFGLKELGLSNEQVEKLQNFLNIQQIIKLKMYLSDTLGKQGVEELETLWKCLQQKGLEKYCRLDVSIMRGFDYYTSTVFEVFDASKEFRAIAGGGRYDDLAGIPGVGYAMGDIALQLFLEKKGKLKLKELQKIYLIAIGEQAQLEATQLAAELRNILPVETDVMEKSLSKQFEYCNQQQFPFAIILGEDELKEGKFKLKDMKSGKEKLKTKEQLIKFFMKLKKAEQ